MARCKECIHGECCSVFIPIRTTLCNDRADEMCELFKSAADVVPKSEVEFLRKTIAENAQRSLEVTLEEIEKAKAEVAREIFEEISKASVEWGCYCITTSKSGFLTDDVNRTLAEFKKKYIISTEIVRDLAEYAVDQDIQNYKENN